MVLDSTCYAFLYEIIGQKRARGSRCETERNRWFMRAEIWVSVAARSIFQSIMYRSKEFINNKHPVWSVGVSGKRSSSATGRELVAFLCKLNGWCGWVWQVVYLWVRMTTLLQVTMKILTTLHLNISDTSSPSQLSRCSLSWRCMFRRITRHLWAENNSLSLFRDQDITFQWQRETSLVRNARTNEISCYRCGSGMGV